MDSNRDNGKESLTKSQQERIKRNKERAIILKQSKLIAHPYAKRETISVDTSIIKIGTVKYKDTGGGFLLEEESEDKNKLEPTVEVQPSIIEPDRPTCNNCDKQFASSWLFDTFDHIVCDDCKDPEVHKLITKTVAINEYLLKNCDFDKREPPLKFITRKNPHNSRWGDMKLYLQIQVEKRALEVWGSKEKIEEELVNREEKRVITKAKKYQKQMKDLRMNMRSSLYDRTSAASHVHEFGPETYNEDEDNYTHQCITCNYEEVFEKM